MAEAYNGDELLKLKVTELKKLLKDKGLSTLGNKPELVNRLLTSGDGLLDASDKELLEDDSILEDSSAVVTGTSVTLAAVSSVKQQLSADDELKNPATALVAALKPASTSHQQSSPNMMESRLKRFGVVSENARKAARTERFGDSSNASTLKNSSEQKPVNNGNALQKRAERFGLTTSALPEQTPVSAQLKKRAQRFGQVTSASLAKVDEQERLLKRKARFDGAATSTDASAAVDTDISDKKKTRLQRFGPVNS